MASDETLGEAESPSNEVSKMLGSLIQTLKPVARSLLKKSVIVRNWQRQRPSGAKALLI